MRVAIPKRILSFKGDYRFLSNFWPARVMYDGVEYDCLEKAYVAAKFPADARVAIADSFGLFKTYNLRELARDSLSPGTAKRLGQKYKDHIREDWLDIRLDVMRQLIAEKFSSKNQKLVDLLLNTRPRQLCEGNTWGDKFWGVCNGEGENHLGKILMARRRELHLARIITNEDAGLGPCQGEDCEEQGYADWELGPQDGSCYCHKCVNKYHPLKAVPQEWLPDNWD